MKNKPIDQKANILNGAVLTDTALHELNEAQDENNSLMKAHIASIEDAICFISEYSDRIDQPEEILDIINRIAYARKFLIQLKKP